MEHLKLLQHIDSWTLLFFPIQAHVEQIWSGRTPGLCCINVESAVFGTWPSLSGCCIKFGLKGLYLRWNEFWMCIGNSRPTEKKHGTNSALSCHHYIKFIIGIMCGIIYTNVFCSIFNHQDEKQRILDHSHVWREAKIGTAEVYIGYLQ